VIAGHPTGNNKEMDYPKIWFSQSLVSLLEWLPVISPPVLIFDVKKISIIEG
jgi:hypothetical protein